MSASLNAIVQAYLNDTEFLEEGRDIAKNREASLPNLRRTVVSFIDSTYNLSTFREQIDKALPAKDTWGVRGPIFLMELNKLAKNHAVNIDGSKNVEVENTLRQIFASLSAEKLGQRIEQFYTFLEQERTRFQQENRPRLKNASLGNCALFISLFAHWLDWTGVTVIYYPSLLTGLKMLIEAEALPTPKGLRTKLDRIVVCTETDHQKVMQALDSLNSATPQLKEITGPYWVERFFLWITLHPESLEETDLVPEAPIVRTIQSGPLLPMPEPHLTEQINELRRHILIDEKLVRRIYHALLAGHVILTGPPGTGKTVLVGRLARSNNST